MHILAKTGLRRPPIMADVANAQSLIMTTGLHAIAAHVPV